MECLEEQGSRLGTGGAGGTYRPGPGTVTSAPLREEGQGSPLRGQRGAQVWEVGPNCPRAGEGRPAEDLGGRGPRAVQGAAGARGCGGTPGRGEGQPCRDKAGVTR